MTIQEYPSLKSIYYQNQAAGNLTGYQDAVTQRRDNLLAIKTGLLISPFKRGFRTNNHFEIFYLPVLKINQLEEQITKLSSEIEKKMLSLPPVARDQVFISNLIDELQSTNEIENVRSSREELGTVIDRIKQNKSDKGRFSGLANQYIKFQDNKYNKIHDVQDFRTIWDELVSQEIKSDDLPDGKQFRKEGEIIRSGDRVVHRGDESEEQIISDLGKLVNEMNDDDIPSLPKCFIAHYFYEYVHPFYDGNGRTGRFIVCSYLSRKLDMMSAITFSSAILKNKDTYYKAFVEMANPYNAGEATFFIISMMQLLLSGQQQVIEKLDDDIDLLKKANNLTDDAQLEQSAENVLFILCQATIFRKYVKSLTDKSLSEYTGLSRFRLNKVLDSLIQSGYIELMQANPKTHKLTLKTQQVLFSN
ncbi:Fic family protein [Levilactobacillus sp. N40-8-2]|uniref:Fic family protein n=1 Tax=Levilactobacillus muriae TaxID=3238987 RepID=UPI0038B3381D